MKRSVAIFTHPDYREWLRIIGVMSLWLAWFHTNRASVRPGDFTLAQRVHQNDLRGAFLWIFCAGFFNGNLKGVLLPEPSTGSAAHCFTMFRARVFLASLLVPFAAIVVSAACIIARLAARAIDILVGSPRKIGKGLLDLAIRADFHFESPFQSFVDSSTMGLSLSTNK